MHARRETGIGSRRFGIGRFEACEVLLEAIVAQQIGIIEAVTAEVWIKEAFEGGNLCLAWIAWGPAVDDPIAIARTACKGLR